MSESTTMPVTIPAQVTAFTPPAPPRMSTVPLWGGATLAMPCPSWCVDAHDSGREHPVDITHVGEQVSVDLPVHGGQETFLRAQIVQSPFADEDRVPSAILWPSEDGDARQHMTPADLDETIGTLEAYLDRLRVLRTRLVAARDEYEAGRSL